MSLYLQVAVGDGVYLLDADHILEIADTGSAAADGDNREGGAGTVVDLRELFEQRAGANSATVLVGQISGETAALLVDRVGNLVEISDSEFRALPPIGPVGLLIDAVCGRLIAGRPLLRLRGERVLVAGSPDSG